MNAVAKIDPTQNNMYEIMEKVIADGDLSKLTPQQRVEYYIRHCELLGLNHVTRPFEYQRFNGKVVLYARKECTEQLRFLHKVSIYKMEKETFDGVFVVTAYARTAEGKEDVSTGAVTITNLKGEALSNAFMKAETKAKRRVTLSICGLGFTDQSEIDSIPNSQPVKVNHQTGEIIAEEIKPTLSEPPKIIELKENLIETIKTAITMNELKEAYSKAYLAHMGDAQLLSDISDLKDKRKQEIADAAIEQFKKEADQYDEGKKNDNS